MQKKCLLLHLLNIIVDERGKNTTICSAIVLKIILNIEKKKIFKQINLLMKL